MSVERVLLACEEVLGECKPVYLRVEEVLLTSLSVSERDPDVLRAPRVHHHVPGVAVETLRPVVVAVGQKVRVRQEALGRQVTHHHGNHSLLTSAR